MSKPFNKSHPIQFKSIEHIIDIIHDRYPLLSKYAITLIVLSFFEEIRSSLSDGYTISLNGFADNIAIIYYNQRSVHKVKAKLRTPQRFKLDPRIRRKR